MYLLPLQQNQWSNQWLQAKQLPHSFQLDGGFKMTHREWMSQRSQICAEFAGTCGNMYSARSLGASCVEGDCRQSVTSAAVAQLQLAQIFPSFPLQIQTSNCGNGALNYFSNTNWKPAHTPSIELQWLQDTTPLRRSKVSEIREQTDGQVDRFSNSLRATSCASFHLSDDFAFSQAITTLVSEKGGALQGGLLTTVDTFQGDFQEAVKSVFRLWTE